LSYSSISSLTHFALLRTSYDSQKDQVTFHEDTPNDSRLFSITAPSHAKQIKLHHILYFMYALINEIFIFGAYSVTMSCRISCYKNGSHAPSNHFLKPFRSADNRCATLFERNSPCRGRHSYLARQECIPDDNEWNIVISSLTIKVM
jgi:hypothetical protein